MRISNLGLTPAEVDSIMADMAGKPSFATDVSEVKASPLPQPQASWAPQQLQPPALTGQLTVAARLPTTVPKVGVGPVLAVSPTLIKELTPGANVPGTLVKTGGPPPATKKGGAGFVAAGAGAGLLIGGPPGALIGAGAGWLISKLK